LRKKDVVIAISLSLLVLAVSIIIGAEQLTPIASAFVRGLGESYLMYSYNPWHANITVFSLNVVTAIIWDYRGLDTFYETCVLLASVVALLAVLRGYGEVARLGAQRLSDVVKAATKLVIPLIAVYSVATALHGQLTPGGGFQGGAIASVAIALAIAVYSLDSVYRKGLSVSRLVVLRVLGLACMLCIAVALALVGALLGVKAYVFQNMAKEDSPIGMPKTLLDTPMAGAVLLYNTFELVIAFSGLSTALIMLSLREEELRKAIEVGEAYE
jgi:multicomponent Na+:H+ antiporter subunit B